MTTNIHPHTETGEQGFDPAFMVDKLLAHLDAANVAVSIRLTQERLEAEAVSPFARNASTRAAQILVGSLVAAGIQEVAPAA
jgi:hypothetical protein